MTDSDWLDAIEARLRAATLRPILGAPGYAVMDDGSVWSTAHNWRGYGARSLTPVEGKDGYLKIRLSVDGKRVNRAVHRLVAAAFLAPAPFGMQIRHLDGNKVNNAASNLAWGTASDNAGDREAHGTTAKGERCGTARLTDESVRWARDMLAQGFTRSEIAELIGVSSSTIARAVSGRTWSHVA